MQSKYDTMHSEIESSKLEQTKQKKVIQDLSEQIKLNE